MIKAPGRSVCRTFSCQLTSTGFAACGTRNIRKMIAAETPSIGKLTQKHHLQETYSVNKPPTNGPAREVMPYVAPRSPVQTAARPGGAATAIIVKAPDDSPPAPRPATARPTISIVEFLDTPQMRNRSRRLQYCRGKWLSKGSIWRIVPAYLVERMKNVRDSRSCCSSYGLVEKNNKCS
jgi:hypothetical protein